MKLLALLALVAVAAAVHRRPAQERDEWHARRYNERSIDEQKYASGKQYEYVYDGQLMTGIPQTSEQHSATRIKAYVVFQFEDHRTVKMFLEHFDIGSYNGEVSEPRSMQPFRRFSKIDMQPQHVATLKKPITFKYDNGMIDDVIFTSEEETWSANIKRSMINLLQVNLQKKHEIRAHNEIQREDEQESRVVKKFDQFRTMEKSIEGECETAYTVVSMPSPFGVAGQLDVLNVTRSINFDNCRRRPDIRYNFRFQTICPTCDKRFNKDERVLRSSTIVRQNMTATSDRSGNLIESTIVDSQYTVVPFTDDGNLVQTYVNMTMQLYRTRPIVAGPHMGGETIDSDTDIMASVDWDVEKEQFFLKGAERKENPFSIPNKIEFVQQVMADLLKEQRDEVKPEATRMFTRLVRSLRLLNKKQVLSASNQWCEGRADMPREELVSACSLYTDALALCGSKDCIDHLVVMIKKEKVTPIKATLLLRKLMNTRTVSKHMIEEIWSIPSIARCEKSPMLCQSAYLAVGSLLNAMCDQNEDRLAIDYKYHGQPDKQMCNREEKKRWVQMLIGKYDGCKDATCKFTMLKTIANAGIDVSIYELEKIIKNRRQEPTSVRVEAILALRLLAPQMPRKIQKTLMPIFMNKQEQPFVRMAAFAKILETQPDKVIIDQLTTGLLTEGNLQVSTYMYTSFMSLANSTNPCEKRVADEIKLSLRHARSLPIGSVLRNSKFVRAQGYGSYINRGMQLDINSIMGNYSSIPKAFVASLHAERANFWMKYLGTVGFSQSNLDGHLRRLMRRSGHHLQTALHDVLSGESESEEKSADSSESDEYSPKFNYRNKLNKMFKDLEIESRESSFPDSDKEVLANLYLRFFNQDYMFFPLDKKTLPAYIKEYLGKSGEDISLESLVERLPLKSVQVPFNVRSATLATESERKISTVFGMPLQWTTVAPAIAKAQGIIKVKINKEERLTKFDVELKEFKPSFSVSFAEKVELWSPILNTGIKVVASIKVHAPFDGQLSLDITKQQPQVKFSWKPSKQRYELLKIETRPETTVRVWPRKMLEWPAIDEQIIQGSEWTRKLEMNKRFGRHELGVEFHAHGEWHTTPARKVSTTPYPFLAGPNKLVVNVQPGIDEPKEFNVVLSGKFFQDMPKKYIQPKFGKFNKFFAKSDEFLAESSSSESHSGPDSSSESEEQEKRYKKYVDEYKSQGVIKNEVQLKFSTRGSESVKREAHIKSTWECDTDKKTCNAVVQAHCAPITRITSTPWKLLSKINVLYPRTPYTVDALVDSASKFLAQINTKWGLEEGDKYMADIKITGQQSDKLKDVIKRTTYYQASKDESTRQQYRSHFSPVGQYDKTLKYGILDEYKMHVDYKLSPQSKNGTQKVFDYVKHYFYSQTETDYQVPKGEQELNSIDARLNIDPINRRYLNVSVETSTQRTAIKDIPVYESLVAPLNIRRTSSAARSFYGVVNEYMAGEGANGGDHEAVCKIRSNHVTTFDGKDYYKPVSTCYELLAKDCTSAESTRFAIEIKRESESTDRKVVRATAEGVHLLVRVAKDGDRLECATNEGEFTRCDDDEVLWGDRRHPLLRVQSYDNQYVKVHLGEEDVSVYFDGYAINVKAPGYTSGILCGICGDFNGVVDECELRTAQGECIDDTKPQDVRRMFKSYISSEGECEIGAEYEKEEHYEQRSLFFAGVNGDLSVPCQTCIQITDYIQTEKFTCENDPNPDDCMMGIANKLRLNKCPTFPTTWRDECIRQAETKYMQLYRFLNNGLEPRNACLAIALCHAA